MLYKEWDSNVLGMPIYELSSFDDNEDNNYVYFKFPYSISGVQHLVSRGFSLCDISVEYFLDIRNFAPSIAIEIIPRFHTNLDVDRILDITANSFYMDRFHKDPNLTEAQANNLYQAWVTNACNGSYGDAVFVYEHSENILGFSICRLDGNIGVIDLTAVDINFLEHTVSPQLILRDLQFFKDSGINFVKTSTQLENVPSKKSLELFGFKEMGTIVTMSKGRNG
jgi:hypothetical protein